eukprot:10170139-Ditylum_brightwellii.AAC.1
MGMIQADSLLAYYLLNDMSDLICLKDTGFPALIGGECIMLRHLSFKQEIGKNKGKDEAMNVD